MHKMVCLAFKIAPPKKNWIKKKKKIEKKKNELKKKKKKYIYIYIYKKIKKIRAARKLRAGGRGQPNDLFLLPNDWQMMLQDEWVLEHFFRVELSRYEKRIYEIYLDLWITKYELLYAAMHINRNQFIFGFHPTFKVKPV